ncbi:MAG TPA: antibiotic biosynthesis monooxygenase [Syntrophorhabdales bacterium]|nr:antibiotic biosynthesis monooxygenase [Syntrophorhabdales bacterium]
MRRRPGWYRVDGGMVVQATVRMVIATDKIDEALHILHSIAERTRVEVGCFDCCVHRDTQDERVIIFEQAWKTEDAMLRHLGSEEYRNVLLVMEMCSEQPEIRFDTIAGSTGVETIEAARRDKKDGE